MDTFWDITAIIGALVFVGLWLDKRARKRPDRKATHESFFEDDEAEDLRASLRKSRASGFRR